MVLLYPPHNRATRIARPMKTASFARMPSKSRKFDHACGGSAPFTFAPVGFYPIAAVAQIVYIPLVSDWCAVVMPSLTASSIAASVA